MKRFFLCLSVLLAMDSLAITGQSQSAAPASSSAQSQTTPASAGSPRKVWTNDDIGGLRGNDSISVVGKVSSPSKTTAPAQSPSYERDPAWYRKQLSPLQAEVEKLDVQIGKLRAFMKGDNVSSNTQPYYHGPPGNPQDQLNQLEKRRQTYAAKIDDLLDLARQNGVEPGALR